MDISLIICLIFFIAPISTVLHELGHVLGARTVKAESATLSIGVGRDIYSISCKRIRFTFHSIFFIGGIAYSERRVPFTAVEIIWITICGPAVNGLAALASYFLFDLTNDVLLLFMLFNLWLAIINIVPFKIKGKQSDGYTILKAISKTHTNLK